MPIPLDDELTMYTYERTTQEDLLFYRWWARMSMDGDLEKVFLKNAHTPGAFMELMRKQDVVLYALDSVGEVYVVAWIYLFMSLPSVSLWVRSDCRKSRAAARLVSYIYSYVFKYVSTIIGITKQERLIKSHKHMGYDVVGKIPGLWDGEDAWVVVLEKSKYRYLIEDLPDFKIQV